MSESSNDNKCVSHYRTPALPKKSKAVIPAPTSIKSKSKHVSTSETVTLKAKKLGKREERQKLERPVFHSDSDNNVKHEVDSDGLSVDDIAHSESVANSERCWGSSTQLKFNSHGKVNLTAQQSHIQSLLRAAISLTHQHLAFEDAYPDLNEKRRVMANLLLTAAKSENGCAEVRSRLKKDAPYVRVLARQPEGRVSKFRNDFKGAAERRVPAALGLEKNAAGREKAAALLCKDAYLFPLDAKGNPMRNKPFQAPAILYTIEAASFENPTCAGIKYHHLFTSTRDDRLDELELPCAMVALAATAVRAVIMDYASEAKEALDFNSTIFAGIYGKLVDKINNVFEDSEKKYHSMMATLYNMT
ncbi:hypothetical protein BV22DRAFT_766598 [Leucogyrophana mollusca]|uniref:Uncharacterized protein n=1 Tax=Leucogyrophana mollusca TaxID=85980 RepID=A0ACB8B7P9_9AGAM|nr:hypothetical protein BV22DRAFT_766598 [Leucogyrophana mollusca]